MGKETEAMYKEEFYKLFDLFYEAGKEGYIVFPDWYPLNFANPANMAAIQKCLGIGGAAKIMIFFCHCCALTSNKIVSANVNTYYCKEK